MYENVRTIWVFILLHIRSYVNTQMVLTFSDEEVHIHV